jgi:hypothetical protein
MELSLQDSIRLHELDIASLPSVSFAERIKLPLAAGIYFVVHQDTMVVMYIGMSTCLHRRLWNHHKTTLFAPKKSLVIYWYAVDNQALLPLYEDFLIHQFKPPLNHGEWNPVPSGLSKPGPLPKGHKPTIIRLPPDLLAWAKAQDEGLSGLVRQLIAAERERRKAPLTPA